jgi:hypothetical protein
MTHLGLILGTAAYMAPEQAKGQPADRRSDIWAFGCVLYEMLTGRRACPGEDIADTLANVLKADPDWAALPAATPPPIRTLLRRCLTKDRHQRLQAIGEARIALEHPVHEEPAQVTASWQSRMGWFAAAVCAMLAGAVTWIYLHPEPPPVVTFLLPAPGTGRFPPAFPAMAVSPDGRRVAFETVGDGTRRLWVRNLDNPSPRMLTEIADLPEIPFWAPDSRRLGFFDGTKLKTVDVNGGAVTTVADTGSRTPGSGSWNQDDVIIFGTLGSPVLYRVPAAGGAPAPVTAADGSQGDTTQQWAPWFLPDGRHFLYSALSRDPQKGAVYAGDLASQTRKPVVSLATRAIYVNPGFLLYLRDRTVVVAQPFDTRTLVTTGDAVPVAEEVNPTGTPASNFGHFSASQNGILAYVANASLLATGQFTWFDRTGKRSNTGRGARPAGSVFALAGRDEHRLLTVGRSREPF